MQDLINVYIGVGVSLIVMFSLISATLLFNLFVLMSNNEGE